MDPNDQSHGVAWSACAIILAGGKSHRMGTDKSMLLYEGLPLVERMARRMSPLFQETLLSTNQPEHHEFLGLPMIPDAYPDAGPLGGILSAMERAHHEECFVVACDILDPPFELFAALHEVLEGHDAAVPRILGSDRFEPLCGWYHARLAMHMRKAVQEGHVKLQDFLRQHDVAVVAVAPGALVNLNTPADFRRHFS